MPGGDNMALALGMGSLYNHAYRPNACYIKNFESAMMEYVALRDIAPDEEITINYNSDPNDLDPLWFAVRTAHQTSSVTIVNG